MKQTVLHRHREAFGGYGASWADRSSRVPTSQSPASSAVSEPCLRDLIQDDIMKSVMVRDRVAHDSLHILIDETRARLGL